ncbi:hypothetical protein [Salmonella phage SSBI34]|nr:hypothetical protein [Salmonella phage SSBI34]
MCEAKFTTVQLLIVDHNGDAWHTGWAENCGSLLRLAYPGLPFSTFKDPLVIKMMKDVDNVTGTLFVIDPVEGEPLLANSTYKGLEKEYKEYLARKTP